MSVAIPLTERLSAWYARESSTAGYDLLMRLPALAYFGLVAWAKVVAITQAVANAGALDPLAQAVTLAAQLATLLVLAIFAALTLVRSKPKARSRGLAPRLAALLSVGLLFGLAFLPRSQPSLFWEATSCLLIASAGVLTSYVVMVLGRSFSTMPEARRLITQGPYRRVRHPLYLAEQIAVFAILLQYRTPAALALVLAQTLLQLQRMRYEEQVLAEAFPAYRDYASRTARLIPGVY